MRTKYTGDTVCLELSVPEARFLLEELAHVRGGARLPKLRQVCLALESLFSLTENPDRKKPGPKPGRNRTDNVWVPRVVGKTDETAAVATRGEET